MMEKINNEKDVDRWDWKLWLWFFLCSIGIFATVPAARSIQRYVYNTVGREFFTYIVLFFVGAGLVILLYLFLFKLKIKRVSQYIWLFICVGLYIYFIMQLKAHPEEAIHFLEYGLLSYFLFKALSKKVHDPTIYITAVLFVLFVGTTDEFIQWMMPERYWDFSDIGLNTLAGGIFILAIWKAIKPKIICKPVKRISVKVLVGVLTLDLIFLGLCLSNTPGYVNRYTAIFNNLSWLRNEEPMTEFGYRHKVPGIGIFVSRLTLRELKETDSTNGKYYGKILPHNISSKTTYENLIKLYTPYTDPFLYEFIIHLYRRETNFNELTKTNDQDERIRISNVAFRENSLIEKYFGNTLKHSGFVWSDKKVNELKKTAFLMKGNYVSKTGRIITSFSLKTAWIATLTILMVACIYGELWKRRLNT